MKTTPRQRLHHRDWTHNNLTHCFLVAPPNMPDSRFEQSVIYIARHDRHGALGLVINQPTTTPLNEILEDLDIETSRMLTHHAPSVLHGGPMRPEVGFVLHTGQPTWQSSVAVTENVCVTTSKDIMEAIARNEGVSNFQICLGHASWETQQLEDELNRGDWFVTAADTSLLFELPHDARWRAAALKAGIDLDWLVDRVGHA